MCMSHCIYACVCVCVSLCVGVCVYVYHSVCVCVFYCLWLVHMHVDRWKRLTKFRITISADQNTDIMINDSVVKNGGYMLSIVRSTSSYTVSQSLILLSNNLCMLNFQHMYVLYHCVICIYIFSLCFFSVEENDIIELEKRYWTIKAMSRTGCLDLELFRQYVCPPLPETLCDGEHS